MDVLGCQWMLLDVNGYQWMVLEVCSFKSYGKTMGIVGFDPSSHVSFGSQKMFFFVINQVQAKTTTDFFQHVHRFAARCHQPMMF